jgi:hypothetical protein
VSGDFTVVPEGETPVAVARWLEDGELQLSIFGAGPIRFLTIDERAPGDRVFEVTARLPLAELARLVPPGSPIGRNDDVRHEALMARLVAAQTDLRHLSVVRRAGDSGAATPLMGGAAQGGAAVPRSAPPASSAAYPLGRR